MLQEGSKKSNLGGHVIAQAQARFAAAFGLEMKEVELHSAAKAAVGRPPKGALPGADLGPFCCTRRQACPCTLRQQWVQATTSCRIALHQGAERSAAPWLTENQS